MLIGFIVGLGVGALLFFIIWQIKRAPYYDKEAHRFYYFTTIRDNPHHGICPYCGAWQQPIIISTAGKMGVYCLECGRERWYDLEERG